jgi:hypothetical protein
VITKENLGKLKTAAAALAGGSINHSLAALNDVVRDEESRAAAALAKRRKMRVGV